jgi:hypothetical protein
MRKSIRFLAVIAALTFLSSVAFGQDANVPTFTPKGSLQWRVGGKSVDNGATKTDSAGFTTDGGFKVGGNISAGSLSSAFQIGIIQSVDTIKSTGTGDGGGMTGTASKPLQVEEAWVSYDFGPASAKVNMKESDTGYNADLSSRVGSSMSMKVDTDVGAYLILQSPNTLITTKNAGEDTKNTVVPVFDLGYENKTLLGDKLIVKGGVVVDAANEADSFKAGESKVGVMPYVSGSFKITERIVLSLDADVGIGMSRITPELVKDEDPQFWGVKFGADINFTDQFSLNGQVRYWDVTSKNNEDGNSKLYFNATAKYTLDSNLHFKGGMFDYSSYTAGKADAVTDAFYGVEVGYSF